MAIEKGSRRERREQSPELLARRAKLAEFIKAFEDIIADAISKIRKGQDIKK